MYTLYFDGSPDYKNRVTRTFITEKWFSNFFLAGGGSPPPLAMIGDMSNKNLIFLMPSLNNCVCVF